MTKDEVIVQLVRDLYESKRKLQDVRELIEKAYQLLRNNGDYEKGIVHPALSPIIEACDELDTYDADEDE